MTPAQISGVSDAMNSMTASRTGLSVALRERTVSSLGKKQYLLKDIAMNIPNGSMVLLLGGSAVRDDEMTVLEADHVAVAHVIQLQLMKAGDLPRYGGIFEAVEQVFADIEIVVHDQNSGIGHFQVPLTLPGPGSRPPPVPYSLFIIAHRAPDCKYFL